MIRSILAAALVCFTPVVLADSATPPPPVVGPVLNPGQCTVACSGGAGGATGTVTIGGTPVTVTIGGGGSSCKLICAPKDVKDSTPAPKKQK
jgi:hypothetical protein